MINLYLYDFSDQLEFEYLYDRLPDLLKNKFKSYQNQTAQKQSLFAWALLSLVLEKDYNLNLMNLDLNYHQNDKPFFTDNPVYFNISHSNNLVGVAIANQPIGLDIEFFNQDKNYLNLCEKLLSDQELEKLSKTLGKSSYLLTNWVIKEAHLKMTGEGIKPSNFKIEPLKKYFQIFNFKNNEYYIALYYLINQKINVKIISSL